MRDPLPAPRERVGAPAPVDRRTPTLRLAAVPPAAPAGAAPATPDERRRARLPDDVAAMAERIDFALAGIVPAPRLLTQLDPTSLARLVDAHRWATEALDGPCPSKKPPCPPNATGSDPATCDYHHAVLRAWWDHLHPAAWLLTRGHVPPPQPR